MQTENIQVIINSESDHQLQNIGNKVIHNERISFDEGVYLFEKASLPYVGALANWKRESLHGNKTYFNKALNAYLFEKHMKIILEDIPRVDYEIKYIHQQDTRSFNRGAMKNIGFLYVKNKYPNEYKSITLVFNDVDTMPYTKNFLNYHTREGAVKHFYGYKYALGGIISIKASDFERINGFPNYWAWGYEDNALQMRVNKSGLSIDRNQFYEIMDKNILQMKDGLQRLVNRNEFERFVDEYKYNKINDGISTISSLEYKEDSNTNFVNVFHFKTGVPDQSATNQVHDLRQGITPFNMLVGRRRGTMGMRLL
jgi:hypothetical protein